MRIAQVAAAVVAGVAGVLAALWLFESVLPQWFYIPIEMRAPAMLLVLLLVGAVVVRSGRPTVAAALVGGAGIAWAYRAIHLLGLCASDLLFRPCGPDEIAWSVVPPALLLVVSAVLLASATIRGRASR